MSEDHFAKALRNFTMDAAAGDAIRHLTDRGYTLSQVRETLSFPAPSEYIAKVMWERLIETHKILLVDPVQTPAGEARVLSARAPVAQTVLGVSDEAQLRGSATRDLPTSWAPPSCISSRLRNSLYGIPAATHAVNSATEIVERRDRYGRKSFLRVPKKESPEEFSPEDYVLIDNGNDIIPGLPWPKDPVWVHKSLLRGSA